MNPAPVMATSNRVDSSNYHSEPLIPETTTSPSTLSQDGDFTTQAALSLTRSTQTNNIVNSLTIDEDDNVFVADEANNRVQKFESNGDFITEFAHPGPIDVAVDLQGRVYVSNPSGISIYVPTV